MLYRNVNTRPSCLRSLFAICLVLAVAVIANCKPGPVLSPDVTADVTSGDAPLAVQFTDASREGGQPLTAASYLWDFGDPASGAANASAEQNPSHTYAQPGTYTVTLTVTAAAGSETCVKNGYIVVAAPPFFGTAGDLVNPAVPLEGAADNLDAEFIALVGTQGYDAAVATMDAAFAAALQTPNDVENLIGRSEALAGRIVHFAPLAGQKAGDVPPCRSTTVLHINGMNVLYSDFLANVGALFEAIGSAPCFDGEDVQVTGIYQVSATDADLSVFGSRIAPRVGAEFGLAAPLVTDGCRQLGAFVDLAEAGNQFLRDWAMFIDVSETDAEVRNRQIIIDEVERQVANRRRNVIIVPHSQGNFFARDTVGALGSDVDGPFKDCVAVVETASPSTVMPPPNARIDICQDPVPQLSLRFSLATCHPWHAHPDGPIDIAAHDFVAAYLSRAAGATARADILDAICDFHFALRNPRIEETQAALSVSKPGVALSAESTTENIELSARDAGFGKVAWYAEALDPRIVLSPHLGSLIEDDPFENHATVTIGSTTYTDSYIGEIRFFNPCAKESFASVLVRVDAGGIVVINFDNIPSDIILPQNFYSDYGVAIITDSNQVFERYSRAANTPPNILCGGAIGNYCGLPLTFVFSPPVNSPSIFIVDDDDGTVQHAFVLEAFDAEGNSLQRIESTQDRRFHTIPLDNVARLHFIASDEWEGLDTLMFVR